MEKSVRSRLAAKRRKNAAHGASPGWTVRQEQAPQGRKKRSDRNSVKATVAQSCLPRAYEFMVRAALSPPRGLLVFHLYPGLAPWAAFFRRFAARTGVEDSIFSWGWAMTRASNTTAPRTRAQQGFQRGCGRGDTLNFRPPLGKVSRSRKTGQTLFRLEIHRGLAHGN
jgi:hypothetical protein